jgi:hypothetical protein
MAIEDIPRNGADTSRRARRQALSADGFPRHRNADVEDAKFL